MNTKALLTNFFILLISSPLFANEEGISDLYTAEGIEGTLLIQSLDGRTEFIHNYEKVDQAYIPASTFKIANTLIALEEGVINQFETISWDGIKRSYAPWNEDQTLATAFSLSCVWCYQTFATEIGEVKYKQYLSSFNYGNGKTGEDVRTFWLEGDLRISVRDQVNFLRKVYAEELPIKQENIEILKDIMLSEETADYKIWVKTGWQGLHGWYVGYIEVGNEVWFFANYIEIKTPADLIFRGQLVIDSLKLQGII